MMVRKKRIVLGGVGLILMMAVSGSGFLFAQGLSAEDQMAMNSWVAGSPMGSIIDRAGVCGLLFGTPPPPVYFGGLFPSDCGNSFFRTNPDDSEDWHWNGVGQMFLIVFSPTFAIFPSEGSDVHWNIMSHEDGSFILTAGGTLSDGSRVRLHWTSDPVGKSAAGDFLYVEGLGYVDSPKP